jgi:hypothetical protein
MFCVQCGAANDGTMAVCAACGHTTAASASVSAPELGKRVSEAASDAGATLVRLAPNPTGALQPAFAALGEQRALAAGAALGLFFAISCLLAAWIAMMRIGFGFQGRVLFGALVMGIVVFASLAAVSAVGRKVLRATGTLGADVFLAGVALQPVSILLLIGSLLGGANFEVIAIAGVLAWTYVLSILYVGVTRLIGISEALAPPFIAVMLLLSLWLSKVVLAAVGGGFTPFRSPFG